jgi:hypothetical protein
MQVKVLLLSLVCVLASLPASGDPGRDRDRHPGGRYDRWPGVIIEPNITIERDRTPNVDTPEFVMAELGRCVAAGVRLFVDCLRHNHGSIMIRRLEACVGSETIPDDPKRIEPCIPLPAAAP